MQPGVVLPCTGATSILIPPNLHLCKEYLWTSGPPPLDVPSPKHYLRCSCRWHYLLQFESSIVLCLLYLTASLKVIGPSQPILVRVGEDIQLTCSLAPKTDAQSMEVRWVRSHRHPAVYVYTDGARVAGEQMAEYRGRTALLSDAISEGRLTLQINDARTSDDGKYRCLFEKDGVYQEADLDLKIIGKDFRQMFWIQCLFLLLLTCWVLENFSGTWNFLNVHSLTKCTVNSTTCWSYLRYITSTNSNGPDLILCV